MLREIAYSQLPSPTNIFSTKPWPHQPKRGGAVCTGTHQSVFLLQFIPDDKLNCILEKRREIAFTRPEGFEKADVISLSCCADLSAPGCVVVATGLHKLDPLTAEISSCIVFSLVGPNAADGGIADIDISPPAHHHHHATPSHNSESILTPECDDFIIVGFVPLAMCCTVLPDQESLFLIGGSDGRVHLFYRPPSATSPTAFVECSCETLLPELDIDFESEVLAIEVLWPSSSHPTTSSANSRASSVDNTNVTNNDRKTPIQNPDGYSASAQTPHMPLAPLAPTRIVAIGCANGLLTMTQYYNSDKVDGGEELVLSRVKIDGPVNALHLYNSHPEIPLPSSLSELLRVPLESKAIPSVANGPPPPLVLPPDNHVSRTSSPAQTTMTSDHQDVIGTKSNSEVEKQNDKDNVDHNNNNNNNNNNNVQGIQELPQPEPLSASQSSVSLQYSPPLTIKKPHEGMYVVDESAIVAEAIRPEDVPLIEFDTGDQPAPAFQTVQVELTQNTINLAVGSALGVAAVFWDVCRCRLEHVCVLPNSHSHDSVLSVRAVDINGDGACELCVGTYAHTLLVYRLFGQQHVANPINQLLLPTAPATSFSHHHRQFTLPPNTHLLSTSIAQSPPPCSPSPSEVSPAPHVTTLIHVGSAKPQSGALSPPVVVSMTDQIHPAAAPATRRDIEVCGELVLRRIVGSPVHCIDTLAVHEDGIEELLVTSIKGLHLFRLDTVEYKVHEAEDILKEIIQLREQLQLTPIALV